MIKVKSLISCLLLGSSASSLSDRDPLITHQSFLKALETFPCKRALKVGHVIKKLIGEFSSKMLYSKFFIIQTAGGQYNLNTVRISELVWISEQAIESYGIT